MTVQNYYYFNLGRDNSGQDIFVTNTYLILLGRTKTSESSPTPRTIYTPYLAKFTGITGGNTNLTIVDSLYSNVATQQVVSDALTMTTYPARLAVCEVTGYYFYAQNKDNITPGIQLTGGEINPLSIVGASVFNPTDTTSIQVFDMHY